MSELHPSFQKNYYLLRRKVFKLFGGAFHVYDRSDNIVFYSEQKAFKLKEDLRLYSGEDKSEEILIIKTPQMLDIGAVYYVTDPINDEDVGAIKRKGLKSMVKDEWVFLSPDEFEIGKLTEKSFLGAMISRFLNIIPQKYIIHSENGEKVAHIKQHFNPFILKYSMDIPNFNTQIDRRLLLGAGILLAAIEGRQD